VIRAPGVLRPLRHRDFALLWCGQTVSMVGSFVHQIAYPFQVLALGGSAIEVGIALGLQATVQLPLLLIAGALVDRLPRRTVLLASDLGLGVTTGAIALLSAAGTLRIEHLYVASVVFGLSAAFFWPAMGAIIPELVPQDLLVAANALRGIGRQGARIGGPILGGALIVSLGLAAAFAFDAATFFASAAALLAVSRAPSVALPREPLLREIRAGFSFVFAVPWLWITIFGFALGNAATTGSWAVALPLYVRDVLGGGAALFGLISAALGIGEALGGLVLGQVRVRRSGLAMYLAAALGGVALVGYGITREVVYVLTLAGLFGISVVVFGVLWESALQRHVPHRLLGRVTSVDWFGGILLGPVAPVAAGTLVSAVGPQPVFLVSGLAIVAFCLLALLVPSIRDLE
jgi:MFS family permease